MEKSVTFKVVSLSLWHDVDREFDTLCEVHKYADQMFQKHGRGINLLELAYRAVFKKTIWILGYPITFIKGYGMPIHITRHAVFRRRKYGL